MTRSNKYFFLTISLSLILAILACNLPVTKISTATVPSTFPVKSTQGIPTQIAKVTSTVEISSPNTDPSQSFAQPRAIVIARINGDQKIVTIANLHGKLLVEYSPPSFSGDGDAIAFLGNYSGLAAIPIAYLHMENGSQTLSRFEKGVSQPVAQASLIMKIISVPGLQTYAFGTLDFQPGNIFQSALFLSEGGQVPINVLTIKNTPSVSITPIAIKMNNTAVVGIYYTMRPWGIGGDIIFQPQNGVWFLDLSSHQVKEILSNNETFTGISPDLTWIASVNWTNLKSVHFYNIKDGTKFDFNTSSDSDRGAGNVVFSPDSSLVAWMEGSGSEMTMNSNFKPRIRIARMNDQGIIFDQQESYFASTLGVPVNWVEPVAWLDNNQLLIRIGTEQQINLLATYTLQSGTLTKWNDGTFLGLVY